MACGRVEALLRRGQAWGERLTPAAPLVLAECVPGGTTTALAVLRGLGLPADGLVSGSLRTSAHGLKAGLVGRGCAAGPAPGWASPRQVLAAVGDPMQALAAGLVLGAALRGVPLLLAGGSQMAAVLALALALAPPAARPQLAATAPHRHHGLGGRGGRQQPGAAAGPDRQPLAGAPPAGGGRAALSPLHQPALRDYERGYVKEGVGAGGLAWLWQRCGRDPQALAEACDRAWALLQAEPPVPPGAGA
jgi:NaMN:DMB phosphoribosyltransferase